MASLCEEYKRMLVDMRGTFDTGVTKDLAWRRQQLKQMQLVVRENHEAITHALRADLGGSKMRGFAELTGVAKDLEHALDHLGSWTRQRWVGGWCERRCVRPEPKGVVLIISPWNFPFILVLGPLIPAIAAGNCVVLKPSELNTQCAPLVTSLINKYMDPRCVRVVQGAAPETTALLAQQWDHIFYTGGGRVGRIVMEAAAKHLTPVSLELGGKSPVIIDETAQMDSACARISLAKWINGGQMCVAPDYVLVHRTRTHEFVSKMKEMVKNQFGDDPSASPEYAKIINQQHVARLAHLIETAGGEIVCGGAAGIDPSQLHVPPTIIMDPNPEAAVMQDEIFGPVLPVLSFTSLDEALKLVKSKETPLALYVYSQSSRNIDKILSTAPSGGSCVNTSLEHVLHHDIPFGGLGPSGMGCYHGKYGFDEFSHNRAVLYKSTLPTMRGPLFPLPNAKSPTPDFVYPLMVRLQVVGLVPPRLKKVGKVGCFAVLAYAAWRLIRLMLGF